MASASELQAEEEKGLSGSAPDGASAARNEPSANQWTAKPWRAVRQDNGDYRIVYNDFGNWLATVHADGEPLDAEIDAHVIAAGPEMLDTLRRLERPAPGVAMLPPWAVGLIRVAIAKAEGRSPPDTAKESPVWHSPETGNALRDYRRPSPPPGPPSPPLLVDPGNGHLWQFDMAGRLQRAIGRASAEEIAAIAKAEGRHD